MTEGITLRKRLKAEGAAHVATVAAICAVGAAIRIALVFQPVRLDEVDSFFLFASRPLSIGLADYVKPNNHLLNTVLVHVSTGLFGDSVLAMRLPALIAGILLIPAAYMLFRRMYNRTAGLVGGALVASSSHLISYSTNARGYSLQALLFLLLIYVTVGLKRREGWNGWVAFVVLGSLLFFTIPTSLYLYAGLLLWLALSLLLKDVENRKRFTLHLVSACAVTAVLVFLLYLPVIMRSGVSSVTSNPWVLPLAAARFLQGLAGNLAEAWHAWNLDLNIVLSIIIALGFIASIMFHRRIAKDRVNIAAPVLVAAAVFLLAGRQPPFVRVWLPLLPIYLGFAAAGLTYGGSQAIMLLTRKWRLKPRFGPALGAAVLVAFTLFICVMVLSSGSAFQTSDDGTTGVETFRDAEVVASFLRTRLRPGDVVRTDELAVPELEYYFLRESVPLGYLAGNTFGAQDPETVKRVWVVEAFGEGHTADRAGESTEAGRVVRADDHSRVILVEGGGSQ